MLIKKRHPVLQRIKVGRAKIAAKRPTMVHLTERASWYTKLRTASRQNIHMMDTRMFIRWADSK